MESDVFVFKSGVIKVSGKGLRGEKAKGLKG